MNGLYWLAWKISGEKLSHEQPDIHYVPQETLSKKFCQKGAQDCVPNALTTPKCEIYMLDSLTLGKPRDDSVLVHEFVHYFQCRSRGAATTKCEWLKRELVAYRTQVQFLQMFKINSDAEEQQYETFEASQCTN
ncbi:MAG: hypothetical protein GC151_04930 [Betaproteobacteria bacterium]|nr:hypothetical protein [Betaproteobacteria bacterium]